jgi:hypothetical protein
MGFIRKVLFIATAGLSGRVFKDNSKNERTAKADAKRTRTRKQTKVKRPQPQAARRAKPQATRRAKPQAGRRVKAARTPQAGRTSRAARPSAVAPIAQASNGTTNELERLADLHARGVLTGQEFAVAKAKILGESLTPDRPDGDPATFPAIEANVAAARHLADLGAPDLGAHDPGAPVRSFGSE